MLKAGALLHSKTMIIDGVWSTIGSTNLDNRSFALNDELNLVIYDAAAASPTASWRSWRLRFGRCCD